MSSESPQKDDAKQQQQQQVHFITKVPPTTSPTINNVPKTDQQDSNNIPNPATTPPCPYDSASFLSKLSFSFFDSIVKIGLKTGTLEQSDLLSLPKHLASDLIASRFQRFWGTTPTKSQHSQSPPPQPPKPTGFKLARTLLREAAFEFVVSAFFRLVYDVLNSLSPLFLGLFVQSIRAFVDAKKNHIRPESWWDPAQSYMSFFWIIALFCVQLVSTSAFQQHLFFVTQVKLRGQTALCSAIYAKSLRLSNQARQRKSSGEIINLTAVDANKIAELCSYLHESWSMIFQLVVGFSILFAILGWSMIVGIVAMVCIIPFQLIFGRIELKLVDVTLRWTDRRMKLLNEMLQGIRIIKLFSWENNFIRNILRVRRAEVNLLRVLSINNAFHSSVISAAPIIVSAVTFITYSLFYNLEMSHIVTALAYFTLLQFPIGSLPLILNFLLEMWVSLRRIEGFLLEDELELEERGTDTEIPLKISSADFEWGALPSDPEAKSKKGETIKSENNKESAHSTVVSPESHTSTEQFELIVEPTTPPETSSGNLFDINLSIRKGAFVCVVGRVGSGKSSLLGALLGEMRRTKGTCEISGSCAYCPQQPWIMNETVRENITFGLPYDEAKYRQAINACSLERDLEMFPASDETEIGEKGINLSGGQKQRISLARAVYFDADVYLLDDTLSAVDAHVGRHIFEHVFGPEGALHSKTRLFVTHQWQYLPQADLVIVMNQGRITETGTYEELRSRKDSEFAALLAEYMADDKQDVSDTASLVESESNSTTEKESNDKSTSPSAQEDATANPATTEKSKKEGGDKDKGKIVQEEDRVRGTVGLRVYWDYAVAFGGPIVVIFVISTFFVSSFNLVLANWWLAQWSSGALSGLNLPTFGYLGIYTVLGLISPLVINLLRDLIFMLCAIRAAQILHNRMFHRIVRAPMQFFESTPVGRILNRFSQDQRTIDNSITWTLNGFLNVSSTATISFVAIIIATPPFIFILLPLLVIYVVIVSIYNRTSREIKRIDSVSRSPIFAHLGETLNGLSTIRAFQIQQRSHHGQLFRVGELNRASFAVGSGQCWLGWRLDVLGSCILLTTGLLGTLLRESTSVALIGLAITYALSVTQYLNWVVRTLADIEMSMSSVERVLHYIRNVDNEAPAVVHPRPPAEWPSEGKIEFQDVVVRYRKELEPVLKGVSFLIKPREKIGVIGRTGAGKTTLMTALFRLLELDSGSISIDGKNISSIGLSDLRSRLSIIPQDPVLFAGTVRSNLDPFQEHSDEEIWTVLTRAHLKEHVEQQPFGLLSAVTENGDNFSVGQRQLLCLARAMLRKTRVLIMDEATASVDLETDALIQKSVRTEFNDRTVLTIAHRLNTIIDYDRILVMDKGVIAEFDSPRELVQRPGGSILLSLIRETGPTNARHILKIILGDLFSSNNLSDMATTDDK